MINNALRPVSIMAMVVASFSTVSCAGDHNVAPSLASASEAANPADPIYTVATPARHFYDPKKLPAPFISRSVNNGPWVSARPRDAQLHVPPGFAVGIWASRLHNPRAMALAPNGDVFVAESAAGKVAVLRDSDHKGTADIVSDFTTGLNKPFGIAFYPVGPNPKYVYIANTDSVARYPYKVGDLHASGPAETVIPDLPAGGYNNHWTRRLLFSPDGKRLYVSVGSAGNVDEEQERRAAILSFNPDGSGYRLVAGGLRNPIGLAWNPVTGALWTAVNERDNMGDDLPNDYVTSVKPGGFYGWPYYYLGPNHDARMPDRPDLKARVITPDVLLEPHCAALSIAFYQARQFPAEYHNDGFTTMHGSWNRSKRTGYKVVRILMKPDGSAQGGFEDFVWGWCTDDDRVWGRPVDTLVAADGSLLITEDGSGRIWRVWYTGKK